MTEAEDDEDHDDIPVALGDRVAFGLLAAVLASLPASALWYALAADGERLAAIASGTVIAVAALVAFAAPRAMPGFFIRLVEAIRWSGRG